MQPHIFLWFSTLPKLCPKLFSWDSALHPVYPHVWGVRVNSGEGKGEMAKGWKSERNGKETQGRNLERNAERGQRVWRAMCEDRGRCDIGPQNRATHEMSDGRKRAKGLRRICSSLNWIRSPGTAPSGGSTSSTCVWSELEAASTIPYDVYPKSITFMAFRY